MISPGKRSGRDWRPQGNPNADPTFRHARRFRRRGAVTLIELMMILVIIALIGAMALPRLSNVMRRQRLDAVGRRIAQDIQLARIQAIRDQANTTITFDATNRRYTLAGQSGNRVSAASYQVSLKASGDDRIQLAGASFGGLSTLTFNKFGIPTAGGTVTIDDGVESQILTVSATTGRVTRVATTLP